MLSKKGSLLVIVLFVAVVLLTGQARSLLDDTTAPFRNDFREMLYMPRGNGLKVLACGFDAPLADALFIKAMVYYGESINDDRTVSSGSAYTYELFDVITDLSPRFNRAYEIGSIFLTASASLDTNLKGLVLLQKGVDTFDHLNASGEMTITDPRWLFHILMANVYEVNIQSKLRRAGDMDGAAEARLEAAKHFREAAKSPDAPPYVLMAASGYESLNRGKGDIVEGNLAVMSVWVDLYEQANARGDKDLAAELQQRVKTMEKHIQGIVDTRRLQELLTEAGKRYLTEQGHLPQGVVDLAQARLIPGELARFPLDPDGTENVDEIEPASLTLDFFWVLPDGSFRSNKLSNLEINSQADLLLNAVILYRRTNRTPPDELEDLVKENYLDAIPVPPLAPLGQRIIYSPETGGITIEPPFGPPPPPELR